MDFPLEPIGTYHRGREDPVVQVFVGEQWKVLVLDYLFLILLTLLYLLLKLE